MSGAEVITAVQCIDACIGIVEVRDAKGLPPKLRQLVDRIPVIEELLKSAHDKSKTDEVSKNAWKKAVPILQ